MLSLWLATCQRSADSTALTNSTSPANSAAPGLWHVYDQALAGAKYIDLTHTLTPSIPVWKGFGPSKFGASVNPDSGKQCTYARDGFEATQYHLTTDQYGTQLDPPAHWAPEYPTIDEPPPTYTVRRLAVISIVDEVAKDPGYHMQVSDIEQWESTHGRIPAGSVVVVRSDWSRDWPNPELATRAVFPGVSLNALKFLHLERHILFHGHEPLDTDANPRCRRPACSRRLHGEERSPGREHLPRRVPREGRSLRRREPPARPHRPVSRA